MGAKINGAGSNIIEIEGVEELKKAEHTIMSDRIVAGTYIIAAALTKGRLKIKNIDPKIMLAEMRSLNKMGVNILKKKNYIIVSRLKKLKSINVVTKPYPGFPTDLQAQIMVLMTKAEGVSTIREGIFENRFMHVSDLRRMGAQIVTNGN